MCSSNIPILAAKYPPFSKIELTRSDSVFIREIGVARLIESISFASRASAMVSKRKNTFLSFGSVCCNKSDRENIDPEEA